MALTATRVTPPSPGRGHHGLHNARHEIVDVVIGATTDYTVGTGFPGMGAVIRQAARMTNIHYFASFRLRATGGAAKNPLFHPTFDDNVVRLFEARAAGAPMAEDEIEQADLVNADVLRVVVVGT